MIHLLHYRRAGNNLTLLLLLTLPALVQSQTVPPDKESLEKSEGAGMAFYADINGYPGPKHVLEMQEALKLTDDQFKDISAIIDEMRENARAMGVLIIAKEQELESSFRQGKASESHTKQLATEIGSLRGALRSVHLTAHIQARSVLTKEQIATYMALRHKEHNQKKGSH